MVHNIQKKYGWHFQSYLWRSPLLLYGEFCCWNISHYFALFCISDMYIGVLSIASVYSTHICVLKGGKFTSLAEDGLGIFQELNGLLVWAGTHFHKQDCQDLLSHQSTTYISYLIFLSLRLTSLSSSSSKCVLPSSSLIGERHSRTLSRSVCKGQRHVFECKHLCMDLDTETTTDL